MPDMLVKLYTLPEAGPALAALEKAGIEIRRGHPAEKQIVAAWTREHFKARWAAACEVGLEQRPVTCYVATQVAALPADGGSPALPKRELLGFSCYDVAGKGILGPIGVREDWRGHGIGKALLLACLHAMAADGYVYAVIGEVGPVGFYAKAVGATIIEGSERGGLAGRLLG